MGEFTMPSLGADMEQGTLLEWRVGVGDRVERGDIIAVVDTEKSAVEVEVFENGVVEELLVEPGTEVLVGTALARIATATAATSPPVTSPASAAAPPASAAAPPASAGAPPASAGAPPAAPPEPTPVVSAPHHEPTVLSPLVRHLAERLEVDTDHLVGTGPGHRVTRDDVEHARRSPDVTADASPAPAGGASPLARRRAEEAGVDLAAVAGTGPGGAVRARDLDVDANEPSPAAPPTAPPTAPPAAPSTGTVARDRRSSIRHAIARQMSTSNREIPHYHLASTLDVHDAIEWLERRNEGRPAADRVLPAALLVRATALAVARHPDLNGHWIDDDFRPADGVHLAVAVALRGGGLVAPVIHHADQLGLEQTMATLRDLVARSRRGSLRGSEVSGGSLTVTDLGDRGADSVHGVIHPPQVALVGFGRIAERPWALDGLLGVRRTVVATLAADHRATDGHTGSALLATVDELLHRPAEL